MKRCPKLIDIQKNELESFIQKSQDSKEIRRSQSVLLIDMEVDYRTIESLTEFKERSVLIFRQRYLKAGLEGLEHERQGKPKRLLNQLQRSDFWSILVLAHLIQEKYGVTYKSKRPFYLTRRR